MLEPTNVEQVVDEAIKNSNKRPTNLLELVSWIRRKAGAMVMSTVADSEDDLGGELTRAAAYRKAARSGIQEDELTMYVETAAELRKRKGQSGSNDDTPIGQRK